MREKMTTVTKHVLVVDRGDGLISRIRGEVDRSRAGTDVVAVADGDAAARELERRAFDVVVASIDHADTDVFDLALGAVGSRPRIERLVLVGRGAGRIEMRSVLGGRVRFIDEVADPLVVDGGSEGFTDGEQPPWIRFEHLEMLDLVRIAALSGSNLAIRLRCLEGDGILAFADGKVVHASTSELVGDDAFFQMILWRCGPVERLPTERRRCYAPNIARPMTDLMDEASRFRELLVDRCVDPPSGRAIQPAAVQVPTPEWRQRLARRLAGVQVVIACLGECRGDCCRRLAEHLSKELDAAAPSPPHPTGRPAFLRIHPGGGGEINLTLIPRMSRHRFLFETLAAGADAVVVCDRYAASGDGWWDRIPFGVPKAASESPDPADWGVIELLQGLPDESGYESPPVDPGPGHGRMITGPGGVKNSSSSDSR